MTAAGIERTARADRDAQPLTESDIRRMRRTPQAKVIRRALDLTQEEFPPRYRPALLPIPQRAEGDQSLSKSRPLSARCPNHALYGHRLLSR